MHLKGENTRQTILSHALNLASAVGLEGLSIGKLASDLNLSKSGLFAHFQSKEELQLQVLGAAAEEFRRLVVLPLLAKSAGRERVEAIYDHWMHWGRSNRFPGGCIFAAAAIELDDRPGPVRERLVTLQKEWIATLKRVAFQASEAGYFASDVDADAFAQRTYGIMLGLYFYSRLLHDSQAEKRARRDYSDLLKSCRPRVPASRGLSKKKKPFKT